jgi:DNA-binding transcriptional LysR family regulator
MAPQVLAGTNETLAERLKRMALGLEPKHVVGSLESVAALTGAGFGIGVLPLSLGKSLRKLVDVKVRLPGGDPLGRLEFHFCCRRDAWEDNELVMRLHDAAKEALRGLRPSRA